MMNQDYRNPLLLMNQKYFVAGVAFILLVAILEIIIALFHTTYCSYPSIINTRRTITNIYVSAPISNAYEKNANNEKVQTIDEESGGIKSKLIQIQRDQDDATRPRRNSLIALTRLLSDEKCNEISDMSPTLGRNRDALAPRKSEPNVYNNLLVGGIQHIRGLTQGSVSNNTDSSLDKGDSDKNKYSKI